MPHQRRCVNARKKKNERENWNCVLSSQSSIRITQVYRTTYILYFYWLPSHNCVRTRFVILLRPISLGSLHSSRSIPSLDTFLLTFISFGLRDFSNPPALSLALCLSHTHSIQYTNNSEGFLRATNSIWYMYSNTYSILPVFSPRFFLSYSFHLIRYTDWNGFACIDFSRWNHLYGVCVYVFKHFLCRIGVFTPLILFSHRLTSFYRETKRRVIATAIGQQHNVVLVHIKHSAKKKHNNIPFQLRLNLTRQF